MSNVVTKALIKLANVRSLLAFVMVGSWVVMIFIGISPPGDFTGACSLALAFFFANENRQRDHEHEVELERARKGNVDG